MIGFRVAKEIDVAGAFQWTTIVDCVEFLVIDPKNRHFLKVVILTKRDSE